MPERTRGSPEMFRMPEEFVYPIQRQVIASVVETSVLHFLDMKEDTASRFEIMAFRITYRSYVTRPRA